VRSRALAAAGVLWLVASSCDRLPGRPSDANRSVRPSQVKDFATLYGRNCAGCHGTEGRPGAAVSLADPVYLALADDVTIRRVAAGGVQGTAMPAFAQSAGGMLTDAQIDAITGGIRSWRQPDVLGGANPPPRVAAAAGDPQRGAEAFGTYCASCHGTHGEGGSKGTAITNDSYLALVSDQGLRTTIIAGRPDLGAPDWRGYLPGRPMSDREVTDVVAWLASQRVESPGQPYAAPSDAPSRSASNDVPR
jgi:mono/diheme cytochrome c family protein